MKQYNNYKQNNIVEFLIPITNFSCKVDEWLVLHCPLQFIREKLKNQGYNINVKTYYFK